MSGVFLPIMYGELWEWDSFHLSTPDGKNAARPVREHESQISETACRLVVAGNRISSILHRLLLLREDPLHRLLPLRTPTKIGSSGPPQVNLTFPLHCLICPAPGIRALPSHVASRRPVTG